MSGVRESFMECPLDRVTREEILERTAAAYTGASPISIEGLNVAKLVAARGDAALMEALHAADMVHIDGAGVALGARLLGRPFPPRRAGIDLMGDLLQQAAQHNVGVFLLGARPEIVASAAEKLRQHYPGLHIAGTRDGYFSDAEAPAIAAQIAASGAGLLFIGISSPKKEIFLQHYMTPMGVRVAMGVGGSFDVLAGVIPRAPQWMQRAGLEWSFRLIQEPRRLAGRYVRTNAAFAVLLLRALLSGQAHTPIAWSPFMESLAQHFGEAASRCRHEIYFLSTKRGWLRRRVRAVGALLRDMVLLLRLPSAPADASDATIFSCVTLLGPSGYETVARAQKRMPEAAKMALVAHPRLQKNMQAMGLQSTVMLRPSPGHVAAAWVHGMRMLWRSRMPVSRVVVASTVIRHALWQASWQRFALYHPTAKAWVLHNDFDMMSSALVAALGQRMQMITLQHGIPTDEFFPTQAATQVVWGERSRAVYAAQHAGRIVVDGLGRNAEIAQQDAPPAGLVVISQTHTPVYGMNLRPLFQGLVASLLARVPALEVWLHPEEIRQASPYAWVPRLTVKHPPHPMLKDAATPLLVVGYCSTALMEAARAGHYIASMGWPVRASAGAWAVGSAPSICADAAEVAALYEDLRTNPQRRKNHQQEQATWLAASIDNTDQFNLLLDGIV